MYENNPRYKQKEVKGFSQTLTYDTQTKKYLNPNTGKWVERPRNNKAKSKKHWNRIVNTIGTTPEFFGWIPENLLYEDIQTMCTNWNHSTGNIIEPDGVIAVFTLILIKGCQVPYEKQDHLWKKGWAQIPSEDLIFWLTGRKYQWYLNMMKAENLIDSHDHYMNGKFYKRYKIVGIFDENKLKMVKCKYRTAKFKKKVFDYKMMIRKQKEENVGYHKALKDKPIRKYLYDNSVKMLSYLDMDYAEEWVNSFKNSWDDYVKDLLENGGLTKREIRYYDNFESYPDYVWYKMSNIFYGIEDMYFNPDDKFGSRFHSMWTNMPAWVRGFIKFKNGGMSEIDIKNSQFYFFSLLCILDSAKLEDLIYDKILPSDNSSEVFLKNDFNKHIIYYSRICKSFYQKHADVKSFVKSSIRGTLYETLADKTGMSRNAVKKTMFAALFSAKNENVTEKNKIAEFIPNVIKLFGILNGTRKNKLKLGPKYLQRLESKIMIDLLFTKYISQHKNKYPVITIHDSVCGNKVDIQGMLNILLETFDEVGIPKPNITCTDYDNDRDFQKYTTNQAQKSVL